MIKCAEQSPRICSDGSIRWYEGDTFELEFNFTFKDENGFNVEVLPNDEISICFRDICNDVIYETSVIGTTTLTVVIDSETSSKFKVGRYKYCVKRISNFVTTVMRKNEVVVE